MLQGFCTSTNNKVTHFEIRFKPQLKFHTLNIHTLIKDLIHNRDILTHSEQRHVHGRKTLKNATFVRIDLDLLNSHNSNVHERKRSYKSREIKKQNDYLIIVYQILVFMRRKYT